MNKTLLEKAKEIITTRKRLTYSEEDKDLVWAWANEEITITAAMKAIEKPNTNSAYSYLCGVIKKMVRDGNIIMNSKSKKQFKGRGFSPGDLLDK